MDRIGAKVLMSQDKEAGPVDLRSGPGVLGSWGLGAVESWGSGVLGQRGLVVFLACCLAVFWGLGPWGQGPWGQGPWGLGPWGLGPWGLGLWGLGPWGLEPWGLGPWDLGSGSATVGLLPLAWDLGG